jgi:MFS family permease
LVFGGFWGSWSTVLPALRDRAGADDRELGLALACLALASLPGMPLSGRLVDRFGPRPVIRTALVLFAGLQVLPGLATGLPALAVTFALLGMTTGFLDVALNAATAAWERLEGERMMAAAHGSFSLGVLFGAVVAGLVRNAGAQPVVVLGIAAAMVLVAAGVQPDYRRPVAVPEPRTGSSLRPVLLLFGATIALSFLCEDAVQSWTALHLERDLAAEPWLSGLGVGLFGGTMAAGRFAQHLLHRPGHDAPLVAAAGTTLAAGILVLALSPWTWLVLLGVVIAGLGVSVLAPVLLSAVGERGEPGRQGADLSTAATLGYAGFLTGPVVVGPVAEATTLPTALSLLSILAMVVAVGGSLLLARGGQAART